MPPGTRHSRIGKSRWSTERKPALSPALPDVDFRTYLAARRCFRNAGPSRPGRPLRVVLFSLLDPAARGLVFPLLLPGAWGFLVSVFDLDAGDGSERGCEELGGLLGQFGQGLVTDLHLP